VGITANIYSTSVFHLSFSFVYIEVTMKVGCLFIISLLIVMKSCTCVPSEMEKDKSYVNTVRQKEICSLIAGTDGRNGPPSNEHQCPLGTYPNCQRMSLLTSKIPVETESPFDDRGASMKIYVRNNLRTLPCIYIVLLYLFCRTNIQS
jgi:hypothetical protein